VFEKIICIKAQVSLSLSLSLSLSKRVGSAALFEKKERKIMQSLSNVVTTRHREIERLGGKALSNRS
jgi:hypothetical protein